MAIDLDVTPYLALVPTLRRLGQHSLWSHYDPEADVLAIHFTEPGAANIADDSEMNDDDVIVRYDAHGEVIGITILRASGRSSLP